jgi:hypothetical protein
MVYSSYPDYAMDADRPLLFTQDESITTNWHMTEPYACAYNDYMSNPWWSADFNDGSFRVKSVNLLPANNDFQDYLENVEIYIDDVYCGTAPASMDPGTWVTVECPGDGLIGSNIQLKREES